MVQHGIQTGYTGNADGSWRQSCDTICVVGTLYEQMLVQDATEREVPNRILHGRVGLQGHSQTQPVDVEPSYHRLFGIVRSLFVYDTCQCRHLFTSHTASLCFRLPLGRPEAIVLAFHTLNQFVDGNVPIDFVSVWNEESWDGGSRVAVRVAVGAVGQGLGNLCGINHQTLGKHGSQLLHRSGRGDDKVHGLLSTVPEQTEQLQTSGAGLNMIATCSWTETEDLVV